MNKEACRAKAAGAAWEGCLGPACVDSDSRAFGGAAGSQGQRSSRKPGSSQGPGTGGHSPRTQHCSPLAASLVDLCGPQLDGVSRSHLSFRSWSQLLNQLVHLDFTVGWELACWHTPESGRARLLCS